MKTDEPLSATVEEYLETVYNMSMEDEVVIGARLAEKFRVAPPTVTEMLKRLVRDGYIEMDNRRQVTLTEAGNQAAEAVLRRHRLTERFLVDMLGMQWHQVHEEACRWEHVMSETVELRLLEVLGHPTVSPYGLPIPGLDELGEKGRESAAESPLTSLDRVVFDPSKTVVVRRLGEPLQTDTALMSRLRRAGVQPGCAVTVSPSATGLLVGSGGETTEITSLVASHVFVSAH